MRDNCQIVLFTDLDGTFLDHENYSWSESLPALQVAKAKGIPVVFCSSKTQAEIIFIQHQIRLQDPFVVENGGAVYIPKHYFPFTLEGSLEGDEFDVFELGTPYSKLVRTLRSIREELKCPVIGFSDMTEREVALDCGLTLGEAGLAKKRQYDEPFKIENGDQIAMTIVLKKIEESGLNCIVGGRYNHLTGFNDKGKAVTLLTELFKKAYGTIFTVGLGDGLNDTPMLRAVDLPVLVKNSQGRHDPRVIDQLPQVRLAQGIGPHGWKAAVLEILGERS